jgi:glycosyltransferase involved in cell wall biosynthesis
MFEWLLILHIAVPLLYPKSLKLFKKKGVPSCNNNGKVTVIIPTRNDCHHLSAKLRELCKPSDLKLEIIVVDSSDSEECMNICRESKCPYSVKCIHVEERGKAKAMNVGWRCTSSEFILFTDVDAHGITPDTVSEALRRLCNDIGLVSPPIAYEIRDKTLSVLEGDYYKRAIDLYIEESKVYSAPTFTGSFLLIRKALFETLADIEPWYTPKKFLLNIESDICFISSIKCLSKSIINLFD